MASDTTVDARGLSCPQPVLETKKALDKASSDVVSILVDTETARNNVERFGKSKGWSASWEEQNGEYKVTFSRK